MAPGIKELSKVGKDLFYIKNIQITKYVINCNWMLFILESIIRSLQSMMGV